MSEQRITGRKTVWEHKSKAFRIDELTVESDEHPAIQWASFERGDAVAALIVNTDTHQVMLIKQFRPPIAAMEGAEHKLLETVAGMIRHNEEVTQSLGREIEEETGYRIPFNPKTGNLVGSEFICEFYASPGGSSEKIFLYYVAVNSNTSKEPGGGIREQGERIETILMPLNEFFDKVDNGAFKDPKIIISGQWLQKRWADRKTDGNSKQEFQLKGATTPKGAPRIVGYYVGDIGKVNDVVRGSRAEGADAG